jgi:predicted membrane protein
MSFFKFYLIMFVVFIAGAMLIGSLDREQPDNLTFAFSMLWLLIFLAKVLGLSNLLVIASIVIVPLVLIKYIGGWVFLIIPILAIGIYVVIDRSSRQREDMPTLEPTEAIGVMMFIAIPTILSFIGALIYYFWW